MLSSGDVSGMFAQQNQAFWGQNNYAQQIGVAPPPPPPGMGGFGGPRPFSYAPQGFGGPGYGGGNRFAGGVMSGLGAAGTFAGGAIGAMGAMNMLPKALAPMLDPLWAFGTPQILGGGGMGGAAGIAGGMAGAALPVGLSMLAAKSIGSFVGGGQQQGMINQTLGQNFQHFNASSRTGQGFSRDDMQSVGQQIRKLAEMPELLTSVDELTKLIPKLRGAGAMQGVHDASEFNKRFKDAIKTIRDVSKVMGTTMEQATEFFAHSRSVGFLGRQGQLQNIVNTQFTSGVTGMSNGQVMAMQSAGADMASSVGARRGFGAMAMTNAAQSIGLAQRSGALRDGLIEDVTGQSGPEGVQAAAGRMTQLMMNASRSAPGRALMAGMAKFDESGRAVGLDEDLVKRLNSGQLDLNEVKKRAQGLSRSQKISFTARQGTLSMALASQVGAGGFAQFMEGITGKKFGEEGTNLVMQRMTGGNEADMDLMMGLAGQGSSEQEMQVMARLRSRESAIRERTSPEAIIKRLKTRVHAATFGHIEAAGARVFTELGKTYDSFIDDFVGRHVMQLSEEGAKNLERAVTSNNGQGLKDMFAAAHGLRGGAASMSGGRAAATVGGGYLAGLALGGPLGALVGGAKGLVTPGVARGLGNTDMAAGLVGGRTQEAEAIRMKDLMGGMDADKASSLLNAGGPLGSSSAVGDYISKLASKQEGFRDASDSKRADMLKEAVERDAIWKNPAATAAYNRARKEHPEMDPATLIVAAGNQGLGKEYRINYSNITGGGSGVAFGNAANITAARQSVEKELDGYNIPKDTQTALKNPKLRKVLTSALSNGELGRAMQGDAGDIIEAAQKHLGVQLTAKEAEDLKQHFDALSSSGVDPNKLKDTLSNLDSVSAAESIHVMQTNYAESSAELRASADKLKGNERDAALRIADSMSAFSKFRGKYDASGSLTEDSQKELSSITGGMRSSMTDAMHMLGKIGDRKHRSEVAAGMGDVGKVLSQTLDQGSRLKTGMHSKGDIKKAFNLSDEDLDATGLSFDKKGKVNLSGAGLAGLEDRIAGLRGTAVSGERAKTAVEGSKDEALMKTLKEIDKNMSIQTTLLAAIAGDKDIKAGAAKAGELGKSYDETHPNQAGSTSKTK